MKLVLRNVNGETISLEVSPSDTFRDLKARMQDKSGIVLDLEQLKYRGKKITDDQIITQYFAEDMNDLSDDAADDNLIVEDLLDPSMMVVCSVPGCANTALTSPEKTFFRFPIETSRCQHWLLLCKRLDLLDKPSAYVSQRHVVCQDHFIVDQLMSTSNGLKLKVGAVPTIIDAHYLVEGTINETDEIITGETECIVPIKIEPAFDYSEDDDDIVSDLEDSYDEITPHPGVLCRLCASDIGEMVDTGEIVYVFSSAAKDQDIAHKINMCLPVTVKSTDPLPKQLCMPCLEKLNICHEFAESCIEAEKKLYNLNKDRGFKSCPITENELNSNQKTDYKSNDENTSLMGTEMSCGTDKNDALCYCCPLCCDGNMANPKDSKESEIIGEIQKMDGIINTEGHYDNRSSHTTNVEEIFGLPTDPLYRKSNNLTCRMCAVAFESLESCLEHAKSHGSTGVLPCSLCELAFYNERSLESHWKAHEREKVSCGTCHRRVSRAEAESHTCGGNRPYRCVAPDCGKSFRSERRLEFHARVHAGADPVSCTVCDKTFSRETNLFEHVRMVHERERPFVCATCGKAFQLRGRMIAHLRVHTGERPFECDLCEGRFYDGATLKGHRATHMEMKPFQCDKCGRCFARKALFNQHTLAHLTDGIPKQQRTCKLCGEVITGAYTKMLEHRRIHHPGIEIKDEENTVVSSKPFKCDECGKSFAYRVTLVAHMRKHTGELPFDCQYCEKRFSQKRSLVLHERTHTGEKPYECETCGKRFSQSAHMYSHLRLHTGEKPYSCPNCPSTFRLKDVRDAHLRKHTGERPYKCGVCEKAFRTSHSYYQHMWIHQGKKPYPCEYCGKAFRRSNGLKIHIRIHTGEKPHCCEVCGRGFAQKQDMKKHLNLHLNGSVFRKKELANQDVKSGLVIIQ